MPETTRREASIQPYARRIRGLRSQRLGKHTTAKQSILFVQALPAAIALVLVVLSRRQA